MDKNAGIYNVSTKDWILLNKILKDMDWGYWNVRDQWSKTNDLKKHYDKYLRSPIALFMLKSPVKFVIVVWGNTAWREDCILHRHTYTEVLKALPTRPPVFS